MLLKMLVRALLLQCKLATEGHACLDQLSAVLVHASKGGFVTLAEGLTARFSKSPSLHTTPSPSAAVPRQADD